MLLRTIGILLLGIASQLSAQSATQHLALGDKAFTALDAQTARSHFEAAAALEPENYAALWKSSRSLMDISSLEREAARRDSLYALAGKYAKRAVTVAPNDPEGHFSLARALGKAAQAQSPRGRSKYAKDIRSEALKCLKLAPDHAGCLHVMGMWNAEVMRLNGFVRTLARTFLGGQIFGTASWSEAIRYMEASVAAEPRRIVHRIDLAGIYAERGEREKAKVQFEAVLTLPASDIGDNTAKAQARVALKTL